MNEFPLNLFFATLETAGIRPTVRDYDRIGIALQTGGPWTIVRLRDTLVAVLARDEDRQERFLRRFDAFFESVPEKNLAEIDTKRLIADLKKLATEPGKPTKPEPPAKRIKRQTPSPKKKTRIRAGWVVLIAAVLAVAVAGALYFKPWETDGKKPIPDKPTPTVEKTEPVDPVSKQTEPKSVRKRIYTDVPYVAKVDYVAMKISEDWQYAAYTSAGLFVVSIVFGLYLIWSSKIPEDEPAEWIPGAKSHFPLGAIGGTPEPRLNRETLDLIADSMGYFLSGLDSKLLNVPASVKATGNNCGIPSLVFFGLKKGRSMLILEDEFAESAEWNPVAGELARGLAKRGIPVVHGKFCGSPDRFVTEDGTESRLEDLEDHRRGYLLLIFTDGKGLRREDAFALEAVSRWPMKAWMDLRSPEFRDETAEIPEKHGIPVYSATASGIVAAVRSFLTEIGAEPEKPFQKGKPDPHEAGLRFGQYVEEFLGDALPWARDCAMIQPVSPGLADKLRLAFHPHLPPERADRLRNLPGTSHGVSGIRFSDEVLKVLREGFVTFRDGPDQLRVMELILAEVEKAKPEDSKDNTRLAWEMVREHVRVETDEKYDAARLARLVQTPLGDAFKAELAKYGFPGQTDKIPMRVEPKDKKARQRIARMNDGFNIPVLEKFPVSPFRLFALVVMIASCLTCAGWGIYDWFTREKPSTNWQIVAEREADARLEIRKGDLWNKKAEGKTGTVTKTPLEIGPEYRLVLYGNGHRTMKEIHAEENKITALALIFGEDEASCEETFPEIRLTIERCYDMNAEYPLQVQSWRERIDDEIAKGRTASIGVELSVNSNDSKLGKLRRWLLETGSVDIIYRLGIDPNDSSNLSEAFSMIANWEEKSQMIWWSDTTAIGLDLTSIVNSYSADFASVINVNTLADKIGKTTLIERQLITLLLEYEQRSGNEIVFPWSKNKIISFGPDPEEEKRKAEEKYGEIITLVNNGDWAKAESEIAGASQVSKNMDETKQGHLEDLAGFFKLIAQAEKTEASKPENFGSLQRALDAYGKAQEIANRLPNEIRVAAAVRSRMAPVIVRRDKLVGEENLKKAERQYAAVTSAAVAGDLSRAARQLADDLELLRANLSGNQKRDNVEKLNMFFANFQEAEAIFSKQPGTIDTLNAAIEKYGNALDIADQLKKGIALPIDSLKKKHDTLVARKAELEKRANTQQAEKQYAEIIAALNRDDWKQAKRDIDTKRVFLAANLPDKTKANLDTIDTYCKSVEAAERVLQQPETKETLESILKNYENASNAASALMLSEKRTKDILVKMQKISARHVALAKGGPKEIARDGNFIAYDNGTVLDTKTGLMWAAKDYEKDIDWQGAKVYCESFRGGGYSDWRMPTQDELFGLYDKSKNSSNPPTGGCQGGYNITELIHITCCCPWASETQGSSGAYVFFYNGNRYVGHQSDSVFYRALPVRAGK